MYCSQVENEELTAHDTLTAVAFTRSLDTISTGRTRYIYDKMLSIIIMLIAKMVQYLNYCINWVFISYYNTESLGTPPEIVMVVASCYGVYSDHLTL